MRELIRLGFVYEEHAQRCRIGRANNGYRGKNYFYEYTMASRAYWTLAGALTPEPTIAALHDIET